MISPVRSMALAAAVVLLAAPFALSQGKGKPAPDEKDWPESRREGAEIYTQGSRR